MTHACRTCLAAVVGVGSMGCGALPEPLICTDEARPAIMVDIRDSTSGAFLGAGARAIVQDGSYADTASADLTGFPYLLAFERPGTYNVTVEKTGYQPWMRSDVRVSRGHCHVETVSLVALLQH